MGRPPASTRRRSSRAGGHRADGIALSAARRRGRRRGHIGLSGRGTGRAAHWRELLMDPAREMTPGERCHDPGSFPTGVGLIFLTIHSIEELVEHAMAAEQAGLASFWLAEAY